MTLNTGTSFREDQEERTERRGKGERMEGRANTPVRREENGAGVSTVRSDRVREMEMEVKDDVMSKDLDCAVQCVAVFMFLCY